MLAPCETNCRNVRDASAEYGMLSTNTVFSFGKAACTAFIPWSWLQVQPSSATGPVWPKAMTAFSSGTAGSGPAALAGRISFGIISEVPAAAPKLSRPRRERLRRSIMLNPSDCDFPGEQLVWRFPLEPTDTECQPRNNCAKRV